MVRPQDAMGSQESVLVAGIGPQEIAMVAGGVVVLVAVLWIANKLSSKFGSTPKQ